MLKKLIYGLILGLTILNGILIFYKVPKMHYIIFKKVIPASILSFNVNDDCDNFQEEIKKDASYIYYLSCVKSDNVSIKYLDGDEYTLKELINNNTLTIEDLIKAGLVIQKVPLKEEDNKIVEDNHSSNNLPNNSETNKDSNNSSSNETPPVIDNNDKVLLSTEEILNYNKIIVNKTDMYYDLDNYLNINEEQIKNYITKYQLPSLPKYNGNVELNNENTIPIKDNCNLDNNDKNMIRKGIIVKRANLRSFPTNIHFYDTKNKQDFDRLQETELHVNTPVLILHMSKDELWYFVISPFYMGWVEKENIGYATKDDIDFFVNTNKFAVVTVSTLNTNNIILDMSVKLPLVSESSSTVNLVIPAKDDNNNIVKKVIAVSKDKVSIGYLPYTKNNVIKQAQKYLGVKYSWGGMDSGVDCSSFVSNVYRTFGFTFPRNTSSQNQSVGTIINLSNKTAAEKLEIIKDTEPSLLFQNGHVMLYIGIINNEPYIIHSSGGTLKVNETILSNSSYLKNINKLIIVGQ